MKTVPLFIVASFVVGFPSITAADEIRFNVNYSFPSSGPIVTDAHGMFPSDPIPVSVSPISVSRDTSYHFGNAYFGPAMIIDSYEPGDYFSITLTPFDPTASISFNQGYFWWGFFSANNGPSSYEIQLRAGNVTKTYPVGSVSIIDTPVQLGVMPPGPCEMRIVGIGGSYPGPEPMDAFGISSMTFSASIVPEPSAAGLFVVSALTASLSTVARRKNRLG